MLKEDFMQIVRTYQAQEQDRKDILEDLNEKLKSTSECHNIEVKILRAAIKKYLKYEEDKDSYIEEDCAIDNLLNAAIDDPKWGQVSE